jgi:hypothetical protein
MKKDKKRKKRKNTNRGHNFGMEIIQAFEID